MNKFLVFVLFFVTLSYYVDCQSKKGNDQGSLDNYKFNIVIDMNHLSHNDLFNYKYIINKEVWLDEEGFPTFLEQKKIYFIRYNYVSSIENGVERFCRLPIDTTVISLSNSELDSIYELTKDIFIFDSSIEYKGVESPKDDYDGEYVTLSIELEDYSTTLKISMGFSEDKVFQRRFKNLLVFIQKISLTKEK